MHLIEQPYAGWLIDGDIIDNHDPNIGSSQGKACLVGLRAWVKTPPVGETIPYQSDD
jgi:hypothetical protein